MTLRHNSPRKRVSITRVKRDNRGFRILDVEARDAFEKQDPSAHIAVNSEIEQYFIPEITEYIRQRGRDYKRGEANPISDELWGRSPVLRKWRTHVPTAMALYPLQKPENGVLADGTPLDDVCRRYFCHGLDGVGLRSRAAVMTAAMYDWFVGRGSVSREIRWVSLACGAAIPVFEAAEELNNHGFVVDLVLADISGKALRFAKALAAREYDLQGVLETVKINILKTSRLADTFGDESFDAVDILGFFEYLPAEDWRHHRFGITSPGAIEFLRNAYSLLRPNGILIFGNMSDKHPQLIFTTDVVQWPSIHPRSIDSLVNIITSAGIPLENVDIYDISDNVYYVVAIWK